MRDKEILDDLDYLQPMGGVGGQFVPPAPLVEESPTLDDQFPDEERDAGDELIAQEDDRLLGAGTSPEFDHSLRRHKRDHAG